MNRKTSFVLLIIFWAMPFAAFAQSGYYCYEILRKAKIALQNDSIQTAIQQLKKLDMCDYSNRLIAERRNLQDSIFYKIDAQRKYAVALNIGVNKALSSLEIEQRKTIAAKQFAESSLREKEAAERALKDAYEAAINASNKLEKSDSAFKTHIEANNFLNVDATKALQMEMDAIRLYNLPYFTETAANIYLDETNSFYKMRINAPLRNGSFISASFSSDSNKIFLFTSGDRVASFDFEGNFLQIEALDDNFLTQHVSPVSFTHDSIKNSYDLMRFDAAGNILPLGKKPEHVFVSQDKSIIIASAGSNVSVWNREGGTSTPVGFKDVDAQNESTLKIKAMAYSPKTKQIITADSRDSMRLWDINGRLKESITCGCVIKSILFSPDGEKLLVYGNNTAVVVNLADKTRQYFSGHSKEITSAIFSPDSKMILTSSKDQTVRSWDLKGQTLEIFKAGNDTAVTIAFSPNGKSIITASAYDVFVWDLSNFPFSKPASDEKNMKDSVYLVTTKTTVIRLKEIKSAMAYEVPAPKAKIRSVIIAAGKSTSGQVIITIDDSLSYAWNLAAARLTRLEGFTRDDESASVISDDGNLLGYGYWNSSALLWDLSKGGKPAEFRGHKALIKGMTISANKEFLLTGSGDRTARIWEIRGGKLLHSFTHPDEVAKVWFSPDGEKILTTCYDGIVRLFDIASGNEEQEFSGTRTSLWDNAQFSNDGNKIITHGPDGSQVWDVQGNVIFISRDNYTFMQDAGGNTVLYNAAKKYYRQIPVSMEDFQREYKYVEYSFSNR